MPETYVPYKIANNPAYPWRIDRNGPGYKTRAEAAAAVRRLAERSPAVRRALARKSSRRKLASAKRGAPRTGRTDH